MLKVITMTALLSWASIAHATTSSNVQSSNFQSALELMAPGGKIKPLILKYLIEQQAAPHWGLDVAFAWDEYHTGNFVIVEIENSHVYELQYAGGILMSVYEEEY